MAKQANGLFGGYVGKIGPVVGYRWKGVWCVRTRPRTVHNPRTEAQQEHRTMFKEGVRLAGRMRWAVNIGLKEPADAMNLTAQNLFVRVNQPAFGLAEGRFAVDYARLCISAGPVAPVAATEVTVDGQNVLTVGFEKNPLHQSAGAYDNVYVWVWCPEAETGYLANPVYRRTRRVSALLPEAMEGKAVHVYLFVQDEHGRCSDTAYGSPEEGVQEADDEIDGVATPEGSLTAKGRGKGAHKVAAAPSAPPLPPDESSGYGKTTATH